MFTIFFNSKKVIDYDTATKSDTVMFSKFFKTLLYKGVMFPPSQFETAFVSSSHSIDDMEKTLGAISKAFKSL